MQGNRPGPSLAQGVADTEGSQDGLPFSLLVRPGRLKLPQLQKASLGAQLVKSLLAMQETWVQSLGRSPGEGKGYPLQYSCLDGGAWQITVHGVAESQTRLRD